MINSFRQAQTRENEAENDSNWHQKSRIGLGVDKFKSLYN